MQKIARQRKRFTALLVLVAMLVSMLPMVSTNPLTVEAANADVRMNLTVVKDASGNDLYTVETKQGVVQIKVEYVHNSKATLSYDTQYLYFTQNHSGGNPTGGKYYTLRTDEIGRYQDVIGGTSYEFFSIPADKVLDIVAHLYGSDILNDPAALDDVRIYMSQGFVLKRRKTSADEWKLDTAPVYNTPTGIRGAAGWSDETRFNFGAYFDVPLKMDLSKYNITTNASPEKGGYVQCDAYDGQAYGSYPVTVSATANEGYTFSGWTVESGGAVLADAGSADTTFKMPNNDVVLTANFKEKEVPAPTKAPVATPTPAPTLKPGQTPSPAPTAVPTPTPEPTPTPKPYVPSSSFSQTRHVSRYYSTDAGYTINRIYEGDVPSKDDDFGYVSSEAEVDVYAFDSIEETRRGYNSYKEGTDAKGNIWYFMDDGTNATYVHPKKYNGYLVDSDDIRFITELTFPSTLTYLGTTYTVTSIGGGTQYYMYPGRYSNSYETNSYGPTCNSYELENSSNSSATYEYLRWERGRVLGVIGNGEIYSLGNSVKRYYSSAVSTIFSTGNSYYVYNTTLEYVTIPSTVTRIESYAFYNCQALKKVIGGSGVTVIDESAFSTTTDSYRQLHLSKTTYLNPTYNSYNYDYYYYNGTFGTNATGVNATMTAWRNSTTLADYLELPVYGSLQIIGEAAFRLRTNLYDVTLPGSVTEIDEEAFYGCTLNSITLPGTGVTIYDAPETLGTKGNVTQKTQIITEPYSKAMNYGLKYEDYYEVRAGYKTTYNNNQSPQETYVSTTTAKKVSREIVDECDVGTYLFFIDNEGDLWRKKNQGNDELPTQLYAGTKFRSLKKLTGTKSSTYFYGCVAVAENGKVYGYSSESRSWTDLKVPQGSTNHQWTCLDFSIYNASGNEVYSGGSDTLETVTYLYYLYDGKIYRKKVFLRSSYTSSYSYASGSSGSGGGSDYSVYYSSTPTVMSASGTNISEFYVFPSFTGGQTNTTNPSNEYKGYAFRLPKVIASDSSGKSWVGDGCYKGTYYYYYASGNEQFYDGYTSEIYAAGYEGVSYVWSLSGASGYRQIFASKDKTRGDTTFDYKTPGSRMSETHESSYDNVNVIDKNGNLIFVKDIMSATASSNCIGAGSATTVLAGKNFVEVIPTNSEEYMLLKDASGNIWAYFITRSSAPKLLFSGADVVHTWKETTVDEYSGCCYYYHNLIVYDSMGRYWRVSTERYYDYASGSSSWYSTETASISNPGLKPNLMTVGYDFIEPLYDNMFRTYGKEFLGWNTKAYGSGKGYQPGYELKLTAPMTLYAQWGAAKNIVRYAPNGGSGIMEEDEYESSVTKVTLSANTFTRKGYEFTGWNTKADGTGTAYADKASIAIPLGTTTLYAQWKAITYTVKIAEDDIRVTPSYSKTYTLSLDQTMTVPAAKPDKSYTITYHLNYQPSMGAQPAWKTAITADNTKASLSFYGWRLYEVTAEGYKYLDHYEPGDILKNLTSTRNGELVLFPYWGGSASYVKLPEVTCTGYDLVGYTTGKAYAPDYFSTEEELSTAIKNNILIMAPNGSGAQYQPKKSETLYAYYKPKQYTVTFDWNFDWDKDGVDTKTNWEGDTKVVTFNRLYGTLPMPTRDGYNFLGWYFTEDDSGNGTGDEVTSQTNMNIAGNHTLYAKWEVAFKEAEVWLTSCAVYWRTKAIPEEETLDPEEDVLEIREGGLSPLWVAVRVTGRFDHMTIEVPWESSVRTIDFDSAEYDSETDRWELPGFVEYVPYGEPVAFGKRVYDPTMYYYEEGDEVLIGFIPHDAGELSRWFEAMLRKDIVLFALWEDDRMAVQPGWTDETYEIKVNFYGNDELLQGYKVGVKFVSWDVWNQQILHGRDSTTGGWQ